MTSSAVLFRDVLVLDERTRVEATFPFSGPAKTFEMRKRPLLEPGLPGGARLRMVHEHSEIRKLVVPVSKGQRLDPFYSLT